MLLVAVFAVAGVHRPSRRRARSSLSAAFAPAGPSVQSRSTITPILLIASPYYSPPVLLADVGDVAGAGEEVVAVLVEGDLQVVDGGGGGGGLNSNWFEFGRLNGFELDLIRFDVVCTVETAGWSMGSWRPTSISRPPN